MTKAELTSNKARIIEFISWKKIGILCSFASSMMKIYRECTRSDEAVKD